MITNFRRSKPSGWEKIRNKQVTGRCSIISVVNHRNAAHNGEYDPKCPACRELEIKTGMKEKHGKNL